MFLDQSFLDIVLIVTPLGLSAIAVVISRIVKYCPGYSWSNRLSRIPLKKNER